MLTKLAGEEAILCICVGGSGFVKVGEESGPLHAHEAVVWRAGEMHRLWTTDSSMTVLLVHFPGRSDLEPPDKLITRSA